MADRDDVELISVSSPSLARSTNDSAGGGSVTGFAPRWRRAVIIAVSACLVFAGVGFPGSVASAEEPARPSTEAQRALADARASGERVEVLGQRSERTTVYANPDGATFTLEESAIPVRVAKPGGGWQAPDATLVRRPDGTVAPKAASVDMVFSGGGDGASLVRIAKQGRSLALGWPGKLPEPKLDGSTALYREVRPGTDLKIVATVEGFQHLLVIKTAEAAADPDLKRITYSLEAQGLSILKGKAGNLTAVDDDGNRVFRAPPAQMWDSAGADQPAAGPLSLTAATAKGSDASESAATSQEAAEPGPGDTVAPMDVTVTQDALTVIPDAEMLADASTLPLYIDPTVTWGESERTLLRSDGYESYGWGNGDDDNGKGVGKCGTWGGYYCGPGYVQRLYFEFAPNNLKGKKVLDATFRVTEPWAFQCDPRWVDLVRTNNISSATTWSTRPKELDWMVDRHVSAGRGSLCDPDSADAPIEFNDNPEESNENLTPTVRDFAAGKFSRLTLEIRAHDESDTSAWKRFRNDAVLAVSFVGLPDKPTGLGIVTSAGNTCARSSSDPATISDPEPLLKAVAQTKPGGEKEAQLRVYFDLDVYNSSNGSWSDVTPGNGSLRPSSGYAGDNSTLTLKWSKLTDGKLYRFHGWTWSYYGSSYLESAASDGYCYFRVDSTAPKAPKVTVNSPYSPCTTNSCPAGGGPGEKATFALAPNTADPSVMGYEYRLAPATTWTRVSGATATASVTPARSGTYTFEVRAFDNVGSGGRRGEIAQVDFRVASRDSLVGRWNFDEASGVALDAATSDGADDLTLASGAARTDRGRRGLLTHDATGTPLAEPHTDRGLTLGGSGYAAAAGPVVEPRASYTVAAWVWLENCLHNYAVITQDAQYKSPFMLGCSGGGVNKWAFNVVDADGPDGEWSARVLSTEPVAAKVWTHLAGVYDASTKQIRFYVNGKLQGSASYTTAWSSDGALQIGRGKWEGGWVDHLPGSIDEVSVWQAALTEQEIGDETKLLVSEGFAGVELVADYSANRGSGTTITDTTSGYNSTLTLAGGATLSPEAIVFDGVDDAATAPGPLVDGNGSFTVTTLVELDGAKLAAKPDGHTVQVLGQRTADGSAWGLWYQLASKETVFDEELGEERTVPVGKWHFGRLNADGTFSSVVSDEAAALDGEVRLTGLHDAVAGTISLYLGLNQNGDATAYTATVGSGDFAVGKGFAGGAWQHYLPGKVTELRLWAGAMASSEQIDYRVGG